MLITRIEPVWANHREQHTALGDLLVQHFREIRAKGDGIDVHEQEVAPKFAVQPVHNTAGISRAVSPAIADEDFGRHRATLRPRADVLAHYYQILSLSMK